jgi:hypothetical protein
MDRRETGRAPVSWEPGQKKAGQTLAGPWMAGRTRALPDRQGTVRGQADMTA